MPSTHYQNQPNQQAVTIDDMCHPHITIIKQINKLLQLMTCAIHTLPESTKSTSCYNWWYVPSTHYQNQPNQQVTIDDMCRPHIAVTMMMCRQPNQQAVTLWHTLQNQLNQQAVTWWYVPSNYHNWWHVPSTHYQNQPNQQAVTIMCCPHITRAVTIDDMCRPHITRIN